MISQYKNTSKKYYYSTVSTREEDSSSKIKRIQNEIKVNKEKNSIKLLSIDEVNEIHEQVRIKDTIKKERVEDILSALTIPSSPNIDNLCISIPSSSCGSSGSGGGGVIKSNNKTTSRSDSDCGGGEQFSASQRIVNGSSSSSSGCDDSSIKESSSLLSFNNLMKTVIVNACQQVKGKNTTTEQEMELEEKEIKQQVVVIEENNGSNEEKEDKSSSSSSVCETLDNILSFCIAKLKNIEEQEQIKQGLELVKQDIESLKVAKIKTKKIKENYQLALKILSNISNTLGIDLFKYFKINGHQYTVKTKNNKNSRLFRELLIQREEQHLKEINHNEEQERAKKENDYNKQLQEKYIKEVKTNGIQIGNFHNRRWSELTTEEKLDRVESYIESYINKLTYSETIPVNSSLQSLQEEEEEDENEEKQQFVSARLTTTLNELNEQYEQVKYALMNPKDTSITKLKASHIKWNKKYGIVTMINYNASS